MQNLIIALLRLEVSKDDGCLSVYLVVDDRIPFTCRITDLTFRKRCCEHLHMIIVFLLLRSDTDGNLATALYSLNALCQKQVRLDIDDAIKPFRKQPHLAGGMQRKFVGLKDPLQDVPLQVIEDDR